MARPTPGRAKPFCAGTPMHRLVTLAAQAAKLLGYLGALAVVAMMLHISLDVVLRNAFRISLDTVPEIVARYYMTALAFLPLAFTLVYMIGTMSLLNIKFNMLNFLVVLLITGIGLDDGVHILHHYKEGEKDIKKLFSTIGRAILLTTVTTVFGFGSLSFSSYRGIAGLGLVLAIGVSMALIFTILVLPIFLKDKPKKE